MLIDWFTVSAQAVNFLILVWLLKRFLYKPILRAIDEREKRIAAQLQDALAKKAEAQKEREEFQNKNVAFDQQRERILREVQAAAETERRRLLEEARKAADALNCQRLEALQNEERSLSQEISRRAQREIFAITRKVLADLAGTSLEEEMTGVFVRRLGELKGEERASLVSALTESSGNAAILRSAFDLSPDDRAAIQKAIRELVGTDLQLRFETTPALVTGLELATDGHKVAWSIADYLTSLETRAGEALKEQAPLEPDARNKTQ